MRLRFALVWILLGLAVDARAGDPAGAVAGGSAFAIPPTLPDPFPLRRVWAPPPQLGELLKSLPAGPVLRMPRRDFERAVQAAARRNEAPAPTLRSANYAAVAEADGLRGTAELTIDSAAAGALFLAEPWTATLSDLKTADGKTVATASDALGRTTWILPAAGEVKLTARWTLRLREAEDAERCELGFPTVPTTMLELDVPADRLPVGGTVLGPFPGVRGGRMLYRIPLGRTTSELRLVKPMSAAVDMGTPTFRVGLTRLLELRPGEATLTATLALEPLRGAPPELIVLLDPAWHVLEVSSAKPLRTATEGLRLRLTPDRDWPTEIVLKLTSARGRAAPTGVDWSPPALSLAGTLPGVDRWEVLFDPATAYLGADLGDYRAEATTKDNPSTRLIGLPVASADGVRRMPRWRLAERDAEYSVVESVEFALLPAPRWIAEVKLNVQRGPIDFLPLTAPAGWQVSAVDSVDERLQGVTFAADGLRWQRPARSGETVSLRYELSPTKPEPGKPIALPRGLLPGASERDGTVTITAPPNAEIVLDPAQGEASPGRWKLSYRGLPPTVQLSLSNRNDPVSLQPTVPIEPGPSTEEARANVAFTAPKATAVLERDGGTTVTATARGIAGGATAARVNLTSTAQLLGIRIGGKWSPSATRSDDQLTIPWPADADAGGEVLELMYSLPAGVAWPGIAFPDAEAPLLRGTVAAGLRRFPELDMPSAPISFEPGVPRTVESAQVSALGWSAAALVFALSFVPRLRSLNVRYLWLLPTAAAGASQFALPDGWAWAVRPLAVALLTALALMFLRSKSVVPAGLACWLLIGTTATAQKDDPALVLIAPGQTGEEAFVPQRLWERLTAKPEPAAPRMLGIHFDGEVQGSIARFTAKVKLELAEAGERRFELPWDGVRLESLSLDGKPALAEAVSGRTTVVVAGAGPHELTAIFQVPLTVLPTGRELRFRGAESATTTLTFRPPVGVVEPTCDSRLGVETFQDGTLTVDHGRGTEVRLSWRDREQSAPPPLVARLAAVWDLSDDETVLTTAFQLSTEATPIRTVTLEVPAGWEPAGATLRSGDGKAGPTSRLRGSRWDAAAQLWTLQFPNVVADRWTLIAKFYPRSLTLWKPTLKLPRLREAVRAEILAAVRRSGLALDDLERVRIIDYPADELFRNFGSIPELKLDRAGVDRVFSAADAGAELRPTLRRDVEQAAGSAETRWTFGPETDADATATFSRTTADLSLELDCPESIVVREVRAADLAAWCRFGTKLQLRFRKPTREGTVEVLGQSSIRLPASGGLLELPAVRLPGSPAAIRLRLPLGWTAHGTDAQRPNLFAAEEAIPVPAKQPTAKVRIGGPHAVADARLHEKVERTADGIRTSARLTFRAPAKQALRLFVAVLDPAALELTVLGQAKLGPPEATPNGSRRLLDIPAERTDDAITLIAGRKGQTDATVSPAELRLDQGTETVAWAERTLTFGPEFQLKEGPADRQEHDVEGTRTWTTKQHGKWTLTAVPPTAAAAPPMRTTTAATDEAPDDGRSEIRGAGWAAALLLLGSAMRFGLRHPEFLIALGLLGAIALETMSAAGLGFLTLAAVGAMTRVAFGLPVRLLK